MGVRGRAHLRGVQQPEAIDFADAHAGQTHLGALAQSVRVGETRAQVQMAGKRIKRSRSVQDQNDEYDDGYQDEQADAQLTQAEVFG